MARLLRTQKLNQFMLQNFLDGFLKKHQELLETLDTLLIEIKQ